MLFVRGRTGLSAVRSAAAALLLILPTAAAAQYAEPATRSVAFEVRAGGSAPAGADGMALVTEPGPAFGGRVSVPLGSRLAVTGDLGVQLLTGAREEAGTALPDMDVLSATGGLEISFREAGNPWHGALSAGAGVASLRTDERLDDGALAPVRLEATAFTARAALKLGYRATPSVSVYLEPGVHLITLGRELTRPFAIVSPELEEPFSLVWTVPVQAAVRIGM